MRRSIVLLTACLAFAAIAGCGNKGPLYYPPPTPKPAPTPVAHPAPAAAATTAPAQSSSIEAPASSSSVVTKPLGGS